MRIAIPLFTIVLFSIGCGGVSEKEKLAHKWRVEKAYSILNKEINSNTPQETINMANAMSYKLDSIYKNMAFDINQDGTFEIRQGGLTHKGNWTLEEGKVVFTPSKGKIFYWTYDDKFVIYKDSSIRVDMIDEGVSLTLAPAPGEKVVPDDF